MVIRVGFQMVDFAYRQNRALDEFLSLRIKSKHYFFSLVEYNRTKEKMFSNFTKNSSLFGTNVKFVSTLPKDEPPPIPDFVPLAKTKAEVKQQNKYVYLPGERLSIKMAKENIKQKKKAQKQKKDKLILSDNDIDNISSSVGRIRSLFD